MPQPISSASSPPNSKDHVATLQVRTDQTQWIASNMCFGSTMDESKPPDMSLASKLELGPQRWETGEDIQSGHLRPNSQVGT